MLFAHYQPFSQSLTPSHFVLQPTLDLFSLINPILTPFLLFFPFSHFVHPDVNHFPAFDGDVTIG